jgi:hypothetical protein
LKSNSRIRDILGYTGPAGQDRYTIAFERFVEVEGEFADAVLGDFNGEQRFVVAVEGKGEGTGRD